MLKYSYLLGVSLVALSGCSTTSEDSGSGNAVREKVYAAPDSQVGNGSTFARQFVPRVVYVDGQRSIKQQNVEMSISDDGQTITVHLNDQSYDFAYDSPGTYLAADSSLLTGFNTSDQVWIVQQDKDTDGSSWGSGYENVGSYVAGYETDPGEVSGSSGTASFEGASTYQIFVENGYDSGVGTSSFQANFDTNVIAGTITGADEDSVYNSGISAIAVDYNPGDAANINGNTFTSTAGDVYTVTGATTPVVADSGFSGAFYGHNASDIGGTFYWIGTIDGQAAVLQGAFASN